MALQKNELLQTGFLIHDTSRLRRTVYDQRLKSLGVTRSQWWVLTNLTRHDGEGYIQAELARLLDMGKVPLGKLLARLEKTGLILRKADADDRRMIRVRISAKGEKLIVRLAAVSKVVNAEIMQGISRENEAIVNQVLAQMKKNLIGMEGRASSDAPATRKRKAATT